MIYLVNEYNIKQSPISSCSYLSHLYLYEYYLITAFVNIKGHISFLFSA